MKLRKWIYSFNLNLNQWCPWGWEIFSVYDNLWFKNLNGLYIEISEIKTKKVFKQYLKKLTKLKLFKKLLCILKCHSPSSTLKFTQMLISWAPMIWIGTRRIRRDILALKGNRWISKYNSFSKSSFSIKFYCNVASECF